MTEPQPTVSPTAASSSSRRTSWIPPIPRPLQRLFDSVPLVTYPPNELPYRSPALSADSLPTLHVFISEEDAREGRPSYNPSCLKWQTYLRASNIPHNLTPSTNHASPTGSLPFLLPAIPSLPEHRLDARPLLPIPSSRLETYAAQRQQQHSSSSSSLPPSTTPSSSSSSHHHHRQQAYYALLDTPIRNAWLYTLYLTPANEPLLQKLYLRPVSRSAVIQTTIFSQLRHAARAEIIKTTTTTTSTSPSWSLSGNIGDLLTWALGGRTVIDPVNIYDEARKAFDALETVLLSESQSEGATWFFGSPQPTLFDATVFSYTYLLLLDDVDRMPWGDDTLGRIVRDCPRLVLHARKVVNEYWPGLEGI